MGMSWLTTWLIRVDVQPAGGDVGGHEDVELALAQLLDGALPLLLRHVAVDRGGGEPARPQPLGEPLGGLLGAHEDDQPVEVLHLEDAGQRVQLLRVRDLEIALVDVGRPSRSAIVTVTSRPRARAARRSAGSRAGMVAENSATCFSAGVVDRICSTSSAKPMLSISSASSSTTKRSSAQVEGALVEVVHHPARGADDDVHAATQGRQLHAVPLPAVHRQHVQPLEVGGVPLERLRDLQGELAGGREDEHLRRLRGQVDPGEDRQCEGGGLPGPGLGEPDDVAPRQQRRDRLGLDR